MHVMRVAAVSPVDLMTTALPILIVAEKLKVPKKQTIEKIEQGDAASFRKRLIKQQFLPGFTKMRSLLTFCSAREIVLHEGTQVVSFPLTASTYTNRFA